MKFADLREHVWPLLEPAEPEPVPKIGLCDITVSKPKELDTTYDLALKYYESEEKRRSDVESKCTIFIGSLGFGITILLNLGKDIFFSSSAVVPTAIFATLLFTIIIVYLCRVVWFAIKALERKGYHVIKPADFINCCDNDLKKELIVKIVNYAYENSFVINDKVSYMTMAQEYFKRAIVSIALYAILMFLTSAGRYFATETIIHPVNDFVYLCYLLQRSL